MIYYKVQILIFVLMLSVCSMISCAAHAQSVIRDAEIESDLRTIASPLFASAGLNADQVKIILIGGDQVNAFVAGGQNLFIYSGMILETKNVGQLAGVIAHESGHMAGGHLVRMRDMADRASMESIVSTVLGLAVGVGAGDSSAGVATAMGGNEFAERTMLSHSRVLESSADQSGMATLERAGYSVQGMADFLEHLSGEEALPEIQRSPYVLTHPLSRERLEAVQSFLAKSRNKDKQFPAEWEEKFRRMQGKLLAFTEPQRALQQYETDTSRAGVYARAIADYRLGKIPEALSLLGTLEKAEPQNPFFAELRGQILFEQSRIPESIVAYRRASQLAPRQGLIHLSFAQALLQDENKAPDEAITNLQIARDNGEKDSPMVYRWLAVAYGRQGKEGLAKLAMAEEALLKGDYGFSMDQARRAGKLLVNDPAARQRARDILDSDSRLLEKKKKKKDDN